MELTQKSPPLVFCLGTWFTLFSKQILISNSRESLGKLEEIKKARFSFPNRA